MLNGTTLPGQVDDAFWWFTKAADAGSEEASMSLGFAKSTGHRGVDLDCVSAVSYYKRVVDARLAQSNCVANTECHGALFGSQYLLLLPSDTRLDPAASCAVEQLSKWVGGPQDCTHARPGRENS